MTILKRVALGITVYMLTEAGIAIMMDREPLLFKCVRNWRNKLN